MLPHRTDDGQQPTPKITRVSHLTEGTHTYTAITREWEPGDPSRCKFCTRCTAYRDGCQFLVNIYVPESEAPHFSPKQLDNEDRAKSRTFVPRLALDVSGVPDRGRGLG